jgi:hypothetical protein
MDRIALGRVVLTSREHVIALEPHDKGLMGMLLRDPYELIDAKDIFADVPNIKIPDDMFELAEHIVKMKSGHFHPEKFEDHYESALKQLIRKKQKGERIEPERLAQPTNIISPMDALRRSLETEGGGQRGRPASVEVRRHELLPFDGQRHPPMARSHVRIISGAPDFNYLMTVPKASRCRGTTTEANEEWHLGRYHCRQVKG